VGYGVEREFAAFKAELERATEVATRKGPACRAGPAGRRPAADEYFTDERGDVRIIAS
jgi:hypothetical protein